MSDDAEADGSPRHCHACGELIDGEADRCPACDEPLAGGPPEPNLDRVTAAILAFVLGGFGVHKFYLGQPMTGVIYLCFVWTLIPVFLGFFEGIIYLTTSDEEFRRRYVADGRR